MLLKMAMNDYGSKLCYACGCICAMSEFHDKEEICFNFFMNFVVFLFSVTHFSYKNKKIIN